jgi:hypothetical protein
MSKKDDPKKVALTKYANSIRTRATEVGDDKYLLAIADRIEQGGNTLAGSIDLAIQTRLELLQMQSREIELSTAKVADTVNNSEEIKQLRETILQLNDKVTVLYTTFVTIADALSWNIGISGEMLDRMNTAREEMQKKQAENEAVPDIPDIPEEVAEVSEIPEDVLPDGVEEFKPESEDSN